MLIQIRKIQDKKDILQAVMIHQDSFQNFFMTELGTQFLMLFYKSVANNKKSLLLGYFENDKLLGFCAATYRSRGFYTSLVKSNLLSYLCMSVYLFLFKFSSLLRLIKNLTKKSDKIADNGDYAEILSIATSQHSQGKGIGQALMIETEKELKLHNCKKLSLTTDFCNNEKTLNFYKKVGFEILYEFISYPNRRMYRLIKKELLR